MARVAMSTPMASIFSKRSLIVASRSPPGGCRAQNPSLVVLQNLGLKRHKAITIDGVESIAISTTKSLRKLARHGSRV